MQISGTPTLVVAGKYRINNEAFSSADEIIDCVNFLVGEGKRLGAEAGGRGAPAPASQEALIRFSSHLGAAVFAGTAALPQIASVSATSSPAASASRLCTGFTMA